MEELDMTLWTNARVFVSGATGLLGSHLTAELVRRGATVICLVRDWVPDSEAVSAGTLDRCRVVRGELEDSEVVLRALNEHEVDTIFHLGAQTIVGTASRSPLSTFESNIKGTWVLLEAARALGGRIERIIVASSDKAYGEHEKLPYTEDTPLVGRFPYDVSKSCADLISLAYAASFKLPVAVTRCGNLYGGGDLNFNRLVPGTIRSALLDESPVIRSDGTFVRDYFYVKDAVDAYLALAERMGEPGFVGEAFNFGTETPMSVTAMAQKILEVLGKPHLPLTIRNQATNEIQRQYLDCAKARRRMHWEPKYTLDDSLRDTAQWYRGWLARATGEQAPAPSIAETKSR
ncbi:MAG TPA: GDP-mannose 4,6-dehydratase [Gemmatimonadaceae bacterium]|jgi:CDP-glucose 4,6-dehydratase